MEGLRQGGTPAGEQFFHGSVHIFGEAGAFQNKAHENEHGNGHKSVVVHDRPDAQPEDVEDIQAPAVTTRTPLGRTGPNRKTAGRPGGRGLLLYPRE